MITWPIIARIALAIDENPASAITKDELEARILASHMVNLGTQRPMDRDAVDNAVLFCLQKGYLQQVGSSLRATIRVRIEAAFLAKIANFV